MIFEEGSAKRKRREKKSSEEDSKGKRSLQREGGATLFLRKEPRFLRAPKGT